jgi:hypothetical protein
MHQNTSEYTSFDARSNYEASFQQIRVVWILDEHSKIEHVEYFCLDM